jgi:hypothetical protein
MAIALPALLRFITSDNPFGIYKLFLSVELYYPNYLGFFHSNAGKNVIDNFS